MVLQLTMCLCLRLLFIFGGEKKGCVLVSDVFPYFQKNVWTAVYHKMVLKIRNWLWFILKEKRGEKFSVTHQKILNPSNLLN